MTDVRETIDSTPHRLPVVIASCLLAIVAGGLLLCSQLTLFDAGSFAGGADFDGDRLFDREYRLVFVLWPVLALGLSMFAGLRQSALAVSVGLGALTLSVSYGVSLLVGYIDAFGLGGAGDGGALRSTVYIVGALSIATAAVTVWWIVELIRRPTSHTAMPSLRAVGMAAFAVSLAASIVSVQRFRSDFEIPLLPQLAALFFVVAAIAALASGTRAGSALAAAAAAARLTDTFDVTVIRGVPFSVVAETAAEVVVLVGLVVALVCSLAVLFPSADGVRSGVGSLRSKLALADEWDD